MQRCFFLDKQEAMSVDANSSKIESSDSKQATSNKNTKDRHVCRLRGLPWSAREKEIREFFKEEKITEVQLVFLRDGKTAGMTGEALVEFQSKTDFDNALAKNRRHLGHRYVEIFIATGEDIDAAAGRIIKNPIRMPKTQHIVRMRAAVHLVKDDLGRPSGEGFVEFASEGDMMNGMGKHRQNMGRRYIELFRSAPDEMLKVLGFGFRGHKLDKNVFKNFDTSSQDPSSTCLLMRGLPYSCTEADITKFFQEAAVTPVRIHRKADGAEAFVEFYAPDDCSKAMSKQKVTF
ncbi:heterogeneous nuclear ribonucleoprotein H [Reticulomyxa filosa]|uniref:Heterogeneous nuclear ribonucleoprotein H n=1 Tax=Reticulomyxa filosa TaxID=46433 RepID=X6MQM0_RETFI|nr:heterogeneous nuclear ribonucleoprotein H [Reticulomyxa filosa]|eukprot:ETO15747.1 heterogeneous nuclear ribonucleoprotein H [Reticulomyxa filosa]